MTSTVARSARPRALIVAAVLLAAESLLASGFGVAQLVRARPPGIGIAIGVGVMMLGYGVLLAAVAAGVLGVRRWSRGPAVATQLIQLPLAWSFRGAQTGWLAVVLAASAVAVVVSVVLPASTAVLARDADGP